jgi:hypothetical protein
MGGDERHETFFLPCLPAEFFSTERLLVAYIWMTFWCFYNFYRHLLLLYKYCIMWIEFRNIELQHRKCIICHNCISFKSFIM